jgi:uncharacterized coiled-coil DUF342 family protein
MKQATEFFTPEQKQLALEIKAKILSGEEVSLEDLLKLTSQAERLSGKVIKEANKPTDVDYF